MTEFDLKHSAPIDGRQALASSIGATLVAAPPPDTTAVLSAGLAGSKILGGRSSVMRRGEC